MQAQRSFQKSFEEEFKKLSELAARVSDIGIAAQVIALSDEAVREKFISKLDEGYQFAGMYCLGEPGAPDRGRVICDFACAPESFCLVRPAFAAVVHLGEKRVLHVEDPYFATGGVPGQVLPHPGQVTGHVPFTLAIPSNAANVIAMQQATAPFAAREAAYLAGLPRPVPVPHPPPPPPKPPTSCSWGTDTYCGSPTVTTCPHYDDSQNDYTADETTVDTAIDD